LLGWTAPVGYHISPPSSPSAEEAARLQAALPPDVAQSSRIRLRDDLEWPCFIVEGSDGFTFCTSEEATTRITHPSRSGSLDDEDRCLTVYHIVDLILLLCA
jgi:hypothetical protein